MNELFTQLEDLFKKAFTFFDGFTAKTEAIIFDEIMKQMLEYDLKDGRIDNKSKKNLSILNSTNKTLKDLLNPAKFRSETSKYLKNFDEVERIQKLMIEKENNLNLKDFDLSKEKKALMNEIVNGILNQKMIDANMVNPIKKIIAKHITSGITYEDARNEIRNFIISDESKRGFLGQYLHLLTKEPLLRYDGAINQKAVDEFQLDGFRIVGSLIIGSMPVCRAMVKGTGKFGKLTKNGKYRVEDIDKIIDIIKTEPGFVEGTNKKNYFRNRNHWGCRHAFVPTRLLDRDLEAFESSTN